MTQEKLLKAKRLNDQLEYLEKLMKEVNFSKKTILNVPAQELTIQGIKCRLPNGLTESTGIRLPEWDYVKFPTGNQGKLLPHQEKNLNFHTGISRIQAKALASFTHIMYEHLSEIHIRLSREFVDL